MPFNNLLSTRALPLVLLLSLLRPSEVAARVGSSDSHTESFSQQQQLPLARELGGRYLGGRPVIHYKRPQHHGRYYYKPKHHGQYDYSYIKRPVDPSEYYIHYKPAAKPTGHTVEHPEPEAPHPAPEPYPVEEPEPEAPTDPTYEPTYKPTAPPVNPIPLPPVTATMPIFATPEPSDYPVPFVPTRFPTKAPAGPSVPTLPPTNAPKPPTFPPNDGEQQQDEIVVVVDEWPEPDPVLPAVTLKPEPPQVDEPEVVAVDPPPVSTIQARLADFALFGGAEFEDPNSYQSQALKRVEEQVGAGSMTDVKLSQYYSLYSIFAATHAAPNDLIVSSRAFGDGPDGGEIPPWRITAGWLENDVDPCEGEWWGIGCQDDRVISIDLFDNGLTGNFPPEVVLLAGDGGFHSTGAGALVSLDIFNNELMSNNGDNSWMSDLGNNLSYLYFQNTVFSGTLPARLPEGLIELDIANSLITGSLDGAAFANLSSLRFLLMDGVQFDSTIPPEIANLPNLEYLFASDSMITGDLSYMENMSVIFEHWVDRNPGLGGTIPDFVGGLTTLQSFSIAECSFVGTIPESLGNLGLMQQMWLYGNQLTGEIPAALGNLSFLRILEVEANNLSDSMPAGVCNNLRNGMLEVLGADCDELACDCCTCCSIEECQQAA